MTSNDLHIAAQNTYTTPNYTYLKEVRDATGYDAVRTADALAIGMYRSCGRLIHGFEMKVSRSDWLRELKDASKAESLMRYCHHWSLIVSDASIVHDGELPPSWGLAVPHVSRKGAAPRLKWITKPPLLNPDPPSMIFLTALVSAAQKVDKVVRDRELAERYQAGLKEAIQHIERKMGTDRLKEVVEVFQEASGITLTKYTSVEAARGQGLAFKEWLKADKDQEYYRSSMQMLKEQAERIVVGINSALKPLEETG